jgi:hypothetical protein
MAFSQDLDEFDSFNRSFPPRDGTPKSQSQNGPELKKLLKEKVLIGFVSSSVNLWGISSYDFQVWFIYLLLGRPIATTTIIIIIIRLNRRRTPHAWTQMNSESWRENFHGTIACLYSSCVDSYSIDWFDLCCIVVLLFSYRPCSSSLSHLVTQCWICRLKPVNTPRSNLLTFPLR